VSVSVSVRVSVSMVVRVVGVEVEVGAGVGVGQVRGVMSCGRGTISININMGSDGQLKTTEPNRASEEHTERLAGYNVMWQRLTNIA
jgi:hypothetical protein